MTISYAITVKDELQELKTLLLELVCNRREQDEIVILYDCKNGDDKVWRYLESVQPEYDNFQINKGEFNNHFADWKNKLTKLCTGTYIFQIDADEVPHKNLLKQLPNILQANYQVDMLRVPRVNTVEGLTQEHIDKWGWNVNEKGWVNWADWQMRIYKNHSDIKWVNKVHEVLQGFKLHGILPIEEEWALYHPKEIKRQEKQNEFYESL